MSAINFGTTVSLDELLSLIIHLRNPIFARGERGIGKSSIMAGAERHFGDAYSYVYFDCANKDLGDIAMPSIDRDKKITEYFLNGIFMHWTGKPMVIMLDEFTKAPQPIQNMLHPLLEARNPRLCDFLLPEGSRVLLTGNLAEEGLGDNIKAHTLNRVTTVTVRKPSAEEWLAWAVNNDIEPVVMAWVNQFPHALASHTDGDQTGNPYIPNPKTGSQGPCVTPRSLELVSHVLKTRQFITPNALVAAMIGTIGESGARDMQAFVDYQDQLPSWEDITANPKSAKLPDSDGACAVMVFGAVAKLDKTTINPWMDYVERMSTEWQACFALSIAKNPAKSSVAFTNAKFSEWCRKNEDVL